MYHYIQTSAPGVPYYFGINNASNIKIEWVAHSLAQINRYVGHAARPISVAEHSLLCVEIAERDLGLGAFPAALLAVLMHDAHESVTGDASSPLKAHLRHIGRGMPFIFDMVELAAAQDFRASFNLRTAFTGWADQIHAADMHALATERRDLMPADDGPGWKCIEGYAPAAWINLRDRDGFTWTDWREAFIAKFEELTEARRIRGEQLFGVTPA